MEKNRKTEKSPAKKVLSAVGTVITIVIFLAALYVVVCVAIANKQNKPVKFFGYSMAIVLTSSMEPEIMAGDLIVFQACDIAEINVGDDIVFTAGSGFGSIAGSSVVHRVVAIENGVVTTQGVNEKTNPSADKDPVTAENFLGICIYNSSVWGGVFTFFSRYGIPILIAVVAVPLIVSQIIKIVRLSKNREDDEPPKKP